MKPQDKPHFPFSFSGSRSRAGLLASLVLSLAFAHTFAANLIPEKRVASGQSPQIAFPTFTDVTAAAGLASTGTPFGDPIWGDINGDDYLDLFVDNHFNAPPYFYLNNGDGTFTNIFATTGIYDKGDRHGSGFCDFDNDGDLDLHITKGAKKGTGLGTKSDELNRNDGGNFFVNIAKQAGVRDTLGRGRSVAWGDFDRDGFPDLLLGNLKTPLVLYRNNGDGTFTDVAATAGLGDLEYDEVDFADYNNDGYPDIYMSDVEGSRADTDRLFKNNGDGTFTDVTAAAGIQPLNQGRSLAWGDYNNDGYLDLFVSRGTDEPYHQTLYKNNGDGTFTDVTDAAGFSALSNNRAAAWGDFDNDGYLDLYVVDSGTDPDGKGPNYLYLNNHDGTFKDVAAQAGVQSLALSRGRGASWADYDNDGFLDLFVTNGEDNTDFPSGPQFLYHNEGNANHWLKVNLIGTHSNRDGLGATVTITIKRAIQYRENNGAMGHYLSQQKTPLHFGLGKASLINQLVVKWPSGTVQTFTNVAGDREMVINESGITPPP